MIPLPDQLPADRLWRSLKMVEDDMARGVMDSLADMQRRRANPSIDIAEDIISGVRAFQEDLDPSLDMIVVLPFLSTAMTISRISRMGAHLLVFDGEQPGGFATKVIAHCSQVSVMMSAVPKEDVTARRIGFDTAGTRKQEKSI